MVQKGINHFFKRPLVNIRDKRLFIIISSPFMMLIGLILAESLSSIMFGGSISLMYVGIDAVSFLFSPGFYNTSGNNAVTNEIKSILNVLKITFWTFLSSTILYLLFKKPKDMK
ncbi:hypothetical protein ABD91_26120 [Lysinibacillus sphaericus]|nr:hypothetical protein [Lysinibacillus sphaericus]